MLFIICLWIPLQMHGKFIDAINPTIAVFTKYEYWYHFFNELHKRNIPLYIISGIFRPNQVFFKWYGGLHRKMLGFVTRFFVQDEESKLLLQTIKYRSMYLLAAIPVSTGFGPMHSSQNRSAIIEEFNKGHKVFIAGSTWPRG